MGRLLNMCMRTLSWLSCYWKTWEEITIISQAHITHRKEALKNDDYISHPNLQKTEVLQLSLWNTRINKNYIVELSWEFLSDCCSLAMLASSWARPSWNLLSASVVAMDSVDVSLVRSASSVLSESLLFSVLCNCSCTGPALSAGTGAPANNSLLLDVRGAPADSLLTGERLELEPVMAVVDWLPVDVNSGGWYLIDDRRECVIGGLGWWPTNLSSVFSHSRLTWLGDELGDPK